LVELTPGTRLRLGEAEIELIAIGKDPSLSHTYSFKGQTLLPTRGAFARVVRGGKVRGGDLIQEVIAERSSNK
jgi:MOSC domain-containing protein YiiM